ncbi:MAG TPA: heme o synthase [Kiritimatiellia bacterium]|nr:heme o synthase [Kiritimatiellia bacterium]
MDADSTSQDISLKDACCELMKPKIVAMVLVTTAIGYFLAGKGFQNGLIFLLTLIGTGLAAGGAAALNNYLERDSDAFMPRTRNRVLPSGKIEPAVALAFGIMMVLSGVSILAWLVNLLSAFLVLLTAFLYVLVYTPLKKMTWLNTPIGAIPGALPPMVGWAAASEELSAGAWVLFAILFVWQHPHFYAIAWIFKDDYRSAGFKMLSVVDPSGRRVFRQAIWFSLILIPVSMSLTWLNITGDFYMFGAIVAGAGMLAASVILWNLRTPAAARRVLMASVLYLPALLALIVVDAGLLSK